MTRDSEKPFSIAVGSLFIECNHLSGVHTELRDFERHELRRGAEVCAQTCGTIGGMLRALGEPSSRIVPLIVASACPGGPLTSECYRVLKTDLLDALSPALPVDGVLLALHGAAAADDAGDLEGNLLASVRALVGPDVPVVATLDLHAHVTEEMVHNASALLAWETYPHRDAFSTGERGAKMLLRILGHECRPTMAMAKVPVIVGGVKGNTEGPGPFADVMRFAKSHEGQSGVLSTSVFLVHPYLDLPEMGGGGLVITENDLDKAESLARDIANRYWLRRFDLEPEVCSPAEAIRKGHALEGGPVLLVETSDCCGGGAAGDSAGALKALIEAGVHDRALVPIVDPRAAERCHRESLGSEVALELGHSCDPQWGDPIRVTGTVLNLSDGRFRYDGGIWGGQHGVMGLSALLQIGEIQVLVTSHPTYEWFDEQYRSMRMDVRGAKFVVVKNPMNYRAAYADVAKAAFILDTPGPTPATLRNVAFQNLERPYYPADENIPDLAPTVYRHEA